MTDARPADVHVTDLMDIPGGGDEVGTPASELERCVEHDTIYRVGGACLDCEREDQ